MQRLGHYIEPAFKYLAPSQAGFLCLMFHRVAPIEDHHIGVYPQITILPERFEAMIAHIAQQYHPIALEDLVSHLVQKKRLPAKSVVVTFDDGYLDNYEIAYPILEKHGVPATIYVTSGFIDQSHYPYEFRLAAWLQAADEVEVSWEGKQYHWQLNEPTKVKDSYRTIKQICKPLSSQQCTSLLSQFIPADWYPEAPQLMSWEQVRELDALPLMTIGAHTHSHPMLSQLKAVDAKQEIERSQEILQEHLGHPVIHFSYPYGAYNGTTIQLLKKAQFQSAVATTFTLTKIFASPHYTITRQDAVNDSIFELTL